MQLSTVMLTYLRGYFIACLYLVSVLKVYRGFAKFRQHGLLLLYP